MEQYEINTKFDFYQQHSKPKIKATQLFINGFISCLFLAYALFMTHNLIATQARYKTYGNPNSVIPKEITNISTTQNQSEQSMRREKIINFVETSQKLIDNYHGDFNNITLNELNRYFPNHIYHFTQNHYTYNTDIQQQNLKYTIFSGHLDYSNHDKKINFIMKISSLIMSINIKAKEEDKDYLKALWKDKNYEISYSADSSLNIYIPINNKYSSLKMRETVDKLQVEVIQLQNKIDSLNQDKKNKEELINAQNVISRAVETHPQMKGQEALIRKYAQLMIEIKQNNETKQQRNP